MASDAGAIVARARALVGVRFRAQGRSREHGLDCIGVVLLATGVVPQRAPNAYRLRGGDIDEVNGLFEASGFARVPATRVLPGDTLIVRSGPAQLHAAVLTPSGHVHAHAGLRRVVETPGRIPWPVLSAWRPAGMLAEA